MKVPVRSIPSLWGREEGESDSENGEREWGDGAVVRVSENDE